ncbi:MAG: hypothetical protein AB1424_13765 [Thermodesulfobacteriota bacterium]
MDAILPESQCRQPGLQGAARMQQWRQAMALPEDAGTYLLEITRFLATVALLATTGLLLLLAG